MQNAKKLFLIKIKRFKTLNLNLSERLQLYRFKSFKLNLGWISKNRIIFINFLKIFLLLRKGLRFSILYTNEQYIFKKLNFIYCLGLLLFKWSSINNFSYINKISLKRLLGNLKNNIKKVQYKHTLNKLSQLTHTDKKNFSKFLFYKRWSLTKLYK